MKKPRLPVLFFVVLAVAAILPVAPSIAADGPASSHTDAEVGYSRERLGNNYSDWHTVYAMVENKVPGGRTIYGTVRQVERFSLKDDTILAGINIPIAEGVNLTTEGENSQSHNVLPIWSGYMELELRFDGGYGVAAGARRTEYRDSRLSIGSLRVDRYFGNLQAAYSYYAISADTIGSVSSHFFQMSYFYSDNDFIRAGYTTGKEIEGAGPLGMLVSEIEGYVVSGRQWLSASWAVSYELGSQAQGTHYTRAWAGLGLRYRF